MTKPMPKDQLLKLIYSCREYYERSEQQWAWDDEVIIRYQVELENIQRKVFEQLAYCYDSSTTDRDTIVRFMMYGLYEEDVIYIIDRLTLRNWFLDSWFKR